MKITILGPAHPLRGGIASFNERLALQFQNEGNEVDVITFSLQYPSLFFPGKTQYSTAPKPENIEINAIVNSINPFNWYKTIRRINKSQPDMLIIRYWTPFLAPCLGTIAKGVQKKGKTKVICLVDNLVPHEKHFFDNSLTRYFMRGIDAYMTMSQSVLNDVLSMKPNAKTMLTPHPMFDNFGDPVSREEGLERLELDPQYRYFLYFGLIRGYKGLDNLIDAFAHPELRKHPFKLIIAGEFYDDPKPYMDQIEKHQLGEHIVLRTQFIPNDQVAHYFCAADLIVLPYKDATQSGVTQIAYHFSKPMLVTHVGGLPEIVPHGIAGYVVQSNVEAIAESMIDFCENNKINYFDEGIEKEKVRFQWSTMTGKFRELYDAT